MSDVINGVPLELLERAERNLCSGEEAYRTQQDLRALLTAQPQASAAQSAPDAHERWLSDPNNEPFPGGLSGIPVPALQSAPAGEREAFEAWLSSLKFVSGQGQAHVEYCLHRDLSDKYTTEWVSDMYRGWQARAAWQRAQSAPVVPDGYVLVPVEPTEEMAKVGTDARWQSCVRDANCVRSIYRAMLAAASKVAPHG